MSITRLITPPDAEPVTLAQVKLDCRIDDTGDADIDAAVEEALTGLITAMRLQCAHKIGRSILPETWEKVLDGFSSGDIALFNPPIIAIESIKHLDAATGVQVTLDPAAYVLDKDSEPGIVRPAVGYSWPSAQSVKNSVKIRYTAGYADADGVPACIKQWIRSAVRYIYCEPAGAQGLPVGFNNGLLDSVKVWRL